VVARSLLGRVIVARTRRSATAGRIVETEAYLGVGDPASHAYRNRLNAGNGSLYALPGTWYVYRSYGIHWCLNLVCGGPDRGSAVLIRAVQPIAGLPTIRRRRPRRPEGELASGPGRLTRALGIDRSLDGALMPDSPVVVTAGGPVADADVLVTSRIGITKAADWPLRFLLSGSPWVSGRAGSMV